MPILLYGLESVSLYQNSSLTRFCYEQIFLQSYLKIPTNVQHYRYFAGNV